MLQMIFQSEVLMDEYVHYYDNDYSIYKNENYNQNYNQKQKVIKNNYYNPHVEINDEDWGFYVEIDSQTPPKHVFPKKNNYHFNLATPPPPDYNHDYESSQKNVNYLPKIQEDDDTTEDQFILDMDLPPEHSNHKANNYREKISKNIFSGITICAITTASIYFYNKIRSY